VDKDKSVKAVVLKHNQNKIFLTECLLSDNFRMTSRVKKTKKKQQQQKKSLTLVFV